jgi:prepilin-type N-terminal cleavage/methylation domain-containing protein
MKQYQLSDFSPFRQADPPRGSASLKKTDFTQQGQMKPLSGRIPASAPRRNNGCSGYSLVELLAVLGIIAIVSSLVVVSIGGLTGSRNLNKAAYDIQGVLEQARTMAMASDTYTWVGFFEESPGSPGVAGVGQVVICIVSSADGTNVYSSLPAGTTLLPGTRLVQATKLMKIPNVHLASLSAAAVTRPSVPASTYEVASSSFANGYTFNYSLTGTT